MLNIQSDGVTGQDFKKFLGARSIIWRVKKLKYFDNDWTQNKFYFYNNESVIILLI